MHDCACCMRCTVFICASPSPFLSFLSILNARNTQISVDIALHIENVLPLPQLSPTDSCTKETPTVMRALSLFSAAKVIMAIFVLLQIASTATGSPIWGLGRFFRNVKNQQPAVEQEPAPAVPDDASDSDSNPNLYENMFFPPGMDKTMVSLMKWSRKCQKQKRLFVRARHTWEVVSEPELKLRLRLRSENQDWVSPIAACMREIPMRGNNAKVPVEITIHANVLSAHTEELLLSDFPHVRVVRLQV